jgi:hypothetical protein
VSDFQPTLKQQLTQIAVASFVPKDETEEDLGKAVLGNIVTKSTATTAESSNAITMNMVQALAELQALGYDKDSDVAKNLIANNKAISATLNKVAESMAKLV